MKTFIHLDEANCPVCLDQVGDELRQRPLVSNVELSSISHCLEVEHDGDDVDALLGVVRTSLRGYLVADNGETVQVHGGAHIAHVCDAHR